jgi:hypothetical protein
MNWAQFKVRRRKEQRVMANVWDDMVLRIKSRGIAFDAGLTDSEVVAVESRFEFRFPPDLRAFLQTALPSGERFPDWRAGDEVHLRDWLDLPRQGVLFDVEHNGFWLDEWGVRPKTVAKAKLAVDRFVAVAPRLIPIYMHRMMPAEPHQPGNPVFSVHQTDIIVYGCDLRDYLNREFLMTEDEQEEWTVPTEVCPIEFWDTGRFQAVRWGPDGICVFDNSRGQLP